MYRQAVYIYHLNCSQIDSRWFICYLEAKSICLSYVEQPSGLAATILFTVGRSLSFYFGQCHHDGTIRQKSSDRLKRGRKVEASTSSWHFIVGFLVLCWRFLQVRRHCWLVCLWLPCDCLLFYNDNMIEKVSRLAVGSFITFWSFCWCLSPPWVFMFLGLLGHCFCKDWRIIGSIISLTIFVCIILLHPSRFSYQKHRTE